MLPVEATMRAIEPETISEGLLAGRSRVKVPAASCLSCVTLGLYLSVKGDGDYQVP